MPSYRDHLLMGSIIAGVFIYLLGPFVSMDIGSAVATLVFVLMGAVFPDIDHRNAVIHRKVKAFLALCTAGFVGYRFGTLLLWKTVYGLCAGIVVYLLVGSLKPQHRGVTHTYWAAVVFGAVTGTVSMVFLGSFAPAVFALVAYLSHLILDRLF